MALIYFDDFEAVPPHAGDTAATPPQLWTVQNNDFQVHVLGPYTGSQCLRNPNNIGGATSGYYNGATDGNAGNAEASVFFEGGNEFSASGTFYGDVLCRLTGSAASPTCYAARIDSNTGLKLFKVTSGSYAQIGSTVGGSSTFLNSGRYYKVSLRCNGSNISIRVWDSVSNVMLASNGSWVADSTQLTRAINVTDTSIPAGTASYAGLLLGFGGMFTHADNFSFNTSGPLVQSALAAYPASTSGRTISLPLPTTAHNTLVCIVGTFNVTTITLNDTLGNTWAQIGSPAANGNNVLNAFWVFDSLGGGGAVTVTINNPLISSGYISAVLLEYNGLLANIVDNFQSAVGNNVNPAPGSIANTTANDLLLAAFCQGTTDIASATIGSGFQIEGLNLGGIATQAIAVADKVSSTSETPVFTIDVGTPWSAIGISFKLSSAAIHYGFIPEAYALSPLEVH